HRVLDPPLHLRNDVPGIALEPMPVEGLGHEAKLDDEIVGKVLKLGLAAFLAPQAQQSSLSLPMITRASEPPMKLRRSKRLGEIRALSNGRVMTPSNS